MLPRNLHIIMMLVVIIGLALALGCSDSPTDPDPGTGDPDPTPEWPEDSVMLPDADAAVFDAAADRLLAILESGDLTTARATLLSELNDGWSGVESATMQADSVTIALVFDDGAVASLVTDEVFYIAPEEAKTRRSEAAKRAVAGLHDKTVCGDVLVAPTHRVHIVNPASGCSTAMTALSQDIKEDFIAMGWDEADIDITEPDGFNDHSFTPDALLNQEGYGIVIFVAQGSHTAMAGEPDRSYMMQCFRGGEYEDGYQEHVTSERWDDYEQWMADGELINYKVFNNDRLDFMDQVFIRGDFLADNILLEDGASVHLISAISSETETRNGFIEAGAGGITTWTGLVYPWTSWASVRRLIANQCGADEAMTEPEAMDLLIEQGLDSYEASGYPTALMLGPEIAQDFYLPAQLRFSAPFDCLPDGTEYYEVEVSYEDCPDLDQSFDFFPGGDHSITGMPPVGGVIEFRAKDSSDTTLGAGCYELELTGGPNDIELCPCEGSLLVDLYDVPDIADHIVYHITYEDPSLPDTMIYVGLDDAELTGMIPGTVSLSAYAFDDGSNAIGIDTIDSTEIRCDGGVADVAFGWITFQPTEWPDGTETIEVQSDYATAQPSLVSMPTNGEASMYGFETYDQVDYTAYAYDVIGDLLDVKSGQHVVVEGENVVFLDFDTFGIILEASTDCAGTGEEVVITATVREWTSYDTTEPTGDPLVGHYIMFETDLGEFSGSYYMTTDDNGQAEVRLSSEDSGFAHVTASILGIEESITINFGVRMTYFVDARSVDFDGVVPDLDDGWMEKFATELQIYYGEYIRMDWDSLGQTYSYFIETLPMPGDTLRFIWTPHPEVINPEADPPFDAPYISEVWLHYWYGTDYERQITVQVTPQLQPLTGELEVEIVLEDPWS